MNEKTFKLVPPPEKMQAHSSGELKFLYFVTYEFFNGAFFNRGNTYATISEHINAAVQVEAMRSGIAKSLGLCPKVLVILNFHLLGIENPPGDETTEDFFPPEDDCLFDLAASFLQERLQDFATHILNEYPDMSRDEAESDASQIIQDLLAHASKFDQGGN
jgi:hypothetical protein